MNTFFSIFSWKIIFRLVKCRCNRTKNSAVNRDDLEYFIQLICNELIAHTWRVYIKFTFTINPDQKSAHFLSLKTVRYIYHSFFFLCLKMILLVINLTGFDEIRLRLLSNKIESKKCEANAKSNDQIFNLH